MPKKSVTLPALRTMAAKMRSRHRATARSRVPGTIFSRDQLEDRLYGWGKEVESNAVDGLIHSVRKKFGAGVIRNVRGLGWTVMLGQAGREEAK